MNEAPANAVMRTARPSDVRTLRVRWDGERSRIN
jgi:hypothetical protein